VELLDPAQLRANLFELGHGLCQQPGGWQWLTLHGKRVGKAAKVNRRAPRVIELVMNSDRVSQHRRGLLDSAAVEEIHRQLPERLRLQTLNSKLPCPTKKLKVKCPITLVVTETLVDPGNIRNGQQHVEVIPQRAKCTFALLIEPQRTGVIALLMDDVTQHELGIGGCPCLPQPAVDGECVFRPTPGRRHLPSVVVQAGASVGCFPGGGGRLIAAAQEMPKRAGASEKWPPQQEERGKRPPSPRGSWRLPGPLE